MSFHKMGKILSIALGLLIIFGGQTFAPLQSQAQNGDTDVIQISNLLIQNITRGEATTILTAAPAASSNCIKFQNIESPAGIAITCPKPKTATYSIRVASDAELLLRTKTKAQIGDFGVGDKVVAFGLWSRIFSVDDGTIKALILRNLSRPEEKPLRQLDNVEVVGIATTTSPAYIAVFQQKIYPCYDFGNQGVSKKAFPCPRGLNSFSEHSASANMKVPFSLEPFVENSRKYIVQIDAATKILGKTRKPISLSDIKIGDPLNVYGRMGSDNQVIEAEIVRDLLRSSDAPSLGQYEGVITQIGQDDVTIRLRDGRIIDFANPFTVGTLIRVKGILDDVKQYLSNISTLEIRKSEEIQSSIPVISLLNPGIGEPGTRVTVTGRGFAPRGNEINFGSVPRAIRDIPSPDGKTFSFVIPSRTPCPPDVFCEQTQIKAGIYYISVTNASGTSETASFQVIAPTAFTVLTNYLQEAVQNQRYSVEVSARGGFEHKWSISSGSLPPGLTLGQPYCVLPPCKDPATISGTPTSPGNYTFTVAVRSENETLYKEYTLVVVQAINLPF